MISRDSQILRQFLQGCSPGVVRGSGKKEGHSPWAKFDCSPILYQVLKSMLRQQNNVFILLVSDVCVRARVCVCARVRARLCAW